MKAIWDNLMDQIEYETLPNPHHLFICLLALEPLYQRHCIVGIFGKVFKWRFGEHLKVVNFKIAN